MDDARATLRRIRSTGTTDQEIEEAIALIDYTNRMEMEINESTSYKECFRGKNLWRTEIVSASPFGYIVHRLG